MKNQQSLGMDPGPYLPLAPENLSEIVAGEYKGYATWLEGGHGLGTDADAYKNYVLSDIASVFINRLNSREVNIIMRIKERTDFILQNNFISAEPSSEKLLIEGDWLTEWGIIGWLDTMNKKMFIDINPVDYCKIQGSGIRPENLVSRYVMRVEEDDCLYKTIFNLEFVGVRD